MTALALGCDAEMDPTEPGLDPVDEIVENLCLAGYPDSDIEIRDDGAVLVGGAAGAASTGASAGPSGVASSSSAGAVAAAPAGTRDTSSVKTTRGRHRLGWAKLLARVFAIDVSG